MSWLLSVILDYIVGKLTAFLLALQAKQARREDIAKRSEASVKPLEKAETAEAIDKAADDALNGF